jgi:2'-5' RNA ligase
MLHRVFVALPISDQLQKEIVGWEKNLPNMPVRYLKGRNLHVTLIPPWYTEDLNELEDLLKKEASRYGRFDIRFNEVSFGPNIYQPRLIWATGNASVDIIDLRDRLADIFAQRRGVERFRLHLTLARFQLTDFPTFPIKKLDERIDWSEGVNSIVIMESHLSREGADYEIIAKALLR